MALKCLADTVRLESIFQASAQSSTTVGAPFKVTDLRSIAVVANCFQADAGAAGILYIEDNLPDASGTWELIGGAGNTDNAARTFTDADVGAVWVFDIDPTLCRGLLRFAITESGGSAVTFITDMMTQPRQLPAQQQGEIIRVSH